MDETKKVSDRQDIMDVLYRYGHYFDGGQLDAYFDLFTEDARVDIGAGEGDKAALIEGITAASAGLAGMETRHFITNIIFDEQAADSASGSAYFLYTETDGETLAPGMTGRYQFSVTRQPGGWKINRWKAVSDRT